MDKENNKNVAHEVLQKINEQKTEPRSRWHFVAHNIFIWFLALSTMILGALAISSIIFRINNVARVTPSTVEVSEWIELMPIIWLVALVVFGYLSYREVRATDRGYKYELSTLLLIMVVASSVAGMALYSLGSGYVLDRVASHVVPFHRDLELVQSDKWLRPDNGFLVGEIQEVNEDNFLLVDPKNNEWQVNYNKNLSVEDSVSVGDRVGIRGLINEGEEHVFEACGLRSLEFKGLGFNARPHHHAGMRLQNTKNEINSDELRNSKCGGVTPGTRPPASE